MPLATSLGGDRQNSTPIAIFYQGLPLRWYRWQIPIPLGSFLPETDQNRSPTFISNERCLLVSCSIFSFSSHSVCSRKRFLLRLRMNPVECSVRYDTSGLLNSNCPTTNTKFQNLQISFLWVLLPSYLFTGKIDQVLDLVDNV